MSNENISNEFGKGIGGDKANLLASVPVADTKVFTVGAYVDKKLLAQGAGSSKQKAETAAAAEAVKQFE